MCDIYILKGEKVEQNPKLNYDVIDNCIFIECETVIYTGNEQIRGVGRDWPAYSITRLE